MWTEGVRYGGRKVEMGNYCWPPRPRSTIRLSAWPGSVSLSRVCQLNQGLSAWPGSAWPWSISLTRVRQLDQGQLDQGQSSQQRGDFSVPQCWRRRCLRSRSPWRSVSVWQADLPRRAAFPDDSYGHVGCSCHVELSRVRSSHIHTASNPNMQHTASVGEGNKGKAKGKLYNAPLWEAHLWSKHTFSNSFSCFLVRPFISRATQDVAL